TDVTIHDFRLQAHNKGQQVDVKTLSVQAQEGLLAIQGTVKLAEQWPVKLVMKGNVDNLNNVNLDKLKGQEIDLTLNGSLLQQLDLAL
ncbi:hypothetical protein, partial [Xenorhabdus bovienii]|uniref:hypothetical protein n=1 Tax=Xenorhabdus bovienii TaxID=40576 RepID=UPI0023B3023F